MMAGKDVKKRSRLGARGIKNADKVQDKELFVATYTDENGKLVRLGKFRLSHEVTNLLANIAYQLKVSRSELVRTLLESYVRPVSYTHLTLPTIYSV